jgi:hypothetical protein
LSWVGRDGEEWIVITGKGVLDYGQQTPLEMYRFTYSRQRSLFGAGFEVWAGHEPFCTGSSQLVWNLTDKSIGDSLTVLDYGQQKTPERYWSTYVPSGFCEWPPDELAKKKHSLWRVGNVPVLWV